MFGKYFDNRNVLFRYFSIDLTLKISIQFALIFLTVFYVSGANAETLRQALAKSYENNATLNRARSELRSTNETLPQARSLFLPSINGTISASQRRVFDVTNPLTVGNTKAYSYGIQIDQRIFNGFQSINNVRQAEAGIRAQRANVLNSEITTLANAAQAFISLSRDRKILSLRRKNLQFLEEQVRAANARLSVGEGTRTDVAQARAQRSAAVAQISAAEAAVGVSEANYRQLIGVDAPGNLKITSLPAGMLPSSIESARQVALNRHPAVKAQLYASDGRKFAVKIAEGDLLPKVNLSGGLSRSINDRQGNASDANISATVTIPLYQGGANHSRVRQAKEDFATSKISVDEIRNQVRAAVDQAWAQLLSARASVSANRAQLEAGRLALNGVVEERKVGQRTTLDVLEAQQVVINAQIGLEDGMASQVAAGYALASAVGRLTARSMSLGVDYFDEQAHYQQVKDKWFGLRTPK